jgi:small conductance mechanosensitive channel
MENIIPKIQELAAIYGVKAIVAIIIFIVGRWIAKAVRKLIRRVMTKREMEPTITNFVCNLVYIALLAFVIIASINQLGIQTTSFIAVIGAAGLAIGLALQGSLANFAAGFLLILFRPFKVGDFIEGAGTSGIVESIQVFVTTLRTPDNKAVIIPNGSLTSGNIINYSAKDTRRVDFVFGVSYDDDLQKVKQVLEEILSQEDRILTDPAPTIGLLEMADSSINFAVRPWVKTADYWDVYFGVMETVKQRFDQEGISIPFPQRDVHMFQQA